MKNTHNKNTNSLTDTVLMIEPVAFGYNPQTSVNNYFQLPDDQGNADVQQQALVEFTALVEKLRENGMNVIVVKDTPYPHTPDSVFPNNWISFHANNTVVFYPMFAENRRLERRMDVLLEVETRTGIKYELIDYSKFEDEGFFLEGTGSIILDRANAKAYASVSQRTNKPLFLDYCKEMELHPVCFEAMQLVDGQYLPIYHTNVLMCLADNYAIVCLEAIRNETEREHVVSELQKDGKKVVEISAEQMNKFAGNMLQLRNGAGEKFLVMSQSAYDSLGEDQIEYLKSQNTLIVASVPVIEKNGGGSVRCMIAEVF